MAETGGIASVEDVPTVVDTDFHLTERQEDFLPYIEPPFDRLLEGSRGDDYGYAGQLYPWGGYFTAPLLTGRVESDPVRSRAAVLDGMAEMGSDRAVVTPTQNLYLGGVHHDDLAAALASAYNEWLLDAILDPAAGAYGAAAIAPQKPREAAAEIDRLADEPAICAAFFPVGGVHPPLGDERYWPIYEAAEAAGLPIMMHSASGTMMLSFPEQSRGLDRELPVHAISHPMVHMTNMASLLTKGVPVRFPDLDFVFQEAGLGYVPYLMRRLDHEYAAKRDDAPMLEHPPSHYVRESCYFTSQPVEGTGDPEYVSSTVRFFGGEDSLLFSTDYPHLDFDHPDELIGLLPGFSDDELRRIYGGTALDVFDF